MTLDRGEAARERDRALSHVEDGADPTWTATTWDLLVEYLRGHPEFFVDDFWTWIEPLPRPRESRALGPLVLRAARANYMVKSGHYRKSAASHMTEKPVWTSLIFDEDYPPNDPPAPPVEIEQTLFADYPPNRKPKKNKPDHCCEAWATFVNDGGNVADRTCVFVHRFAHRRTPFSAGVLAQIANTNVDHARYVIDWAVNDGWVSPVQPEFPGQLPEPVWMGRLTKER